MSSDPFAVELEGVHYHYPGRLSTLVDIDLTLKDGEIVSVIGPSGCGKSTLLNLIAGLRNPSTGTISVRGQVLPKRLGAFSYMPQRDLLLPWRTALDNAALLIEGQGTSRTQARSAAMAMMKQFGLEQFASSLPAQLSGGMRQRVALIRTFLLRRDVLLDEPLGALDAITRTLLQEWLLALQASTGQAILMVTHDVEEAIFLSDRVCLMTPRPGRLVWQCEVNFSRPRERAITTTAEFSKLKEELMARLRSAMNVESDVTCAA